MRCSPPFWSRLFQDKNSNESRKHLLQTRVIVHKSKIQCIIHSNANHNKMRESERTQNKTQYKSTNEISAKTLSVGISIFATNTVDHWSCAILQRISCSFGRPHLYLRSNMTWSELVFSLRKYLSGDGVVVYDSQSSK